MFDMKPIIIKNMFKGQPHYILTWSPLTKADKYKINSAVPAVSGVYELYKMDKEKKLNLLSVTHAWYGGLRSNIREAIDPYTKTDPELIKMLEDDDIEIYYRYSCSDSFGDLLDVVWFLHSTYFPNDIRVESSNRYENFFLSERAPDNVYWLE
ncbi:hypothetical protein [Treponema pedis]|uniref:Uncharacterized protein n=1 Tax=Treponema pedis TaxID=409322 RepID=A0A7S6WQI3_9SPIR|nr:hypothetical protein [Treponema pedis]QOW60887.1 hypothetical protein IFE08_00175 [Treponema pedis]QSI04063.1 hypothetical protein DYQ05_03545 [Treponema pedis]